MLRNNPVVMKNLNVIEWLGSGWCFFKKQRSFCYTLYFEFDIYSLGIGIAAGNFLPEVHTLIWNPKIFMKLVRFSKMWIFVAKSRFDNESTKPIKIAIIVAYTHTHTQQNHFMHFMRMSNELFSNLGSFSVWLLLLYNANFAINICIWAISLRKISNSNSNLNCNCIKNHFTIYGMSTHTHTHTNNFSYMENGSFDGCRCRVGDIFMNTKNRCFIQWQNIFGLDSIFRFHSNGKSEYNDLFSPLVCTVGENNQ